MHTRIAFWTLTTLVFAACGDGKTDTDSSTGGASTGTTGAATDSTIGVSSEPSTGEVVTDGTAEGTGGGTSVDPNPTDVTEASVTSDAPSTGGGTDPGGTTEPDETTGGVDPGIAGACMQLCVQAVECRLMANVEACTAECSEGFGGGMGQCKQAAGAFLECAAGLDCEQLAALFIEEDAGPCAPQQAELAMQCQGEDCVGSAGSNREGTECSLTSECEGQPKLEMQCDTEICTCLSDGEPGPTCPAEGICMMTEQIGEKAAACCGF